jgi:hypothetical protein
MFPVLPDEKFMQLEVPLTMIRSAAILTPATGFSAPAKGFSGHFVRIAPSDRPGEDEFHVASAHLLVELHCVLQLRRMTCVSRARWVIPAR